MPLLSFNPSKASADRTVKHYADKWRNASKRRLSELNEELKADNSYWYDPKNFDDRNRFAIVRREKIRVRMLRAVWQLQERQRRLAEKALKKKKKKPKKAPVRKRSP